MVAQMIPQSRVKLRLVNGGEQSDRVARYTANLVNRWRTADPEWLARGIAWYGEIHNEVKALAQAAGVPMEMACGIAAVLSIDNTWRRNFIGLGEVLSALKRGETECPKSAHRYGHARAKVTAIMQGHDPEWAMDNFGKGSSAYKCRRFYRNLLGDLTVATVDRWMYRMCEDNPAVKGVPSGRSYLDCEAAIIDGARIVGIDPAKFQAGLWTDELREGAY